MFNLYNLNNNFDYLVRKRYSCRTFDGKGVEKEKLDILKNKIEKINSELKEIRFGIIDKRILKSKNFFSRGTYGMFKGDIFYIVGAMKKNIPYGWEKFGFYMENLLMLAEDINLNTCWIGGVFDRKGFGSEIDVKDDEIVPAIVPIGYAAEKRTLRDKIVRWSAKGDKRKNSEDLFFFGDFSTPISLDNRKELKEILENVRLAPSASNKQPWRFLFHSNNKLDFFIKRDKIYAKLIPSVDLQRIDIGIAIFHFLYSLKERGIEGKFFNKKISFDNNFEYIIGFEFKNKIFF